MLQPCTDRAGWLHARGSANTGTQAQEGIDSCVSILSLGRSGGYGPSCAGWVVLAQPALTTDQGARTLACSALNLYLQRKLKQQTPPLLGRVTNLMGLLATCCFLGFLAFFLWVLVVSTGGHWSSVLAVAGLQYWRSLVLSTGLGRPHYTGA